MNPYRRRAVPTAPPQPPGPHTAEAWCAYLERASGARVEAVQVPDGADAKETLRAFRGAAYRSTDLYRQLQPAREA